MRRIETARDDQTVVQLTTRIPQQLWRATKIAAVEREQTLGALIAEALREHLARLAA